MLWERSRILLLLVFFLPPQKRGLPTPKIYDQVLAGTFCLP